MKRSMTIALVVPLILSLLLPYVVYADSAFSNIKADLAPTKFQRQDATGQVIINYSKGQQNWQVQVKVQNLQPDLPYKAMVVADPDLGIGPREVGRFVTDGDGNANIHNVVNTLPREIIAVRILIGWGTLPAPERLKLVARADGQLGQLHFRGTGRGE